MSQANTVPLPSPPPTGSISADIVAVGPPIAPIDRIKLFSNEQWEDFVLEWVDSLRDQYVDVQRCGGAGDMGRDVIAIVKDGNGAWDNYQCKHYKEPLQPKYPPLRGEWQRHLFVTLLCALILLLRPTPSAAFELSGGVSLGVVAAGTEPHFAITPHVGILWHKEKPGLLFALHNLFNMLPPTNALGAGVYNHSAVTLGYTSDKANIALGPSVSIYSIPACGISLCGRVVGLAPGGQAHANVYLAEPLGLSFSAHIDWIGGSSLVLPGGLAAMFIAGPVLRWKAK